MTLELNPYSVTSVRKLLNPNNASNEIGSESSEVNERWRTLDSLQPTVLCNETFVDRDVLCQSLYHVMHHIAILGVLE